MLDLVLVPYTLLASRHFVARAQCMLRGRLLQANRLFSAHLRSTNASRSGFVTSTRFRSISSSARAMSQEGPAQGQPGQSSAPHPVHSANDPAPPATGAVIGSEGAVAGQAPPAATKNKQGGRQQGNEQKKASKKDDIAKTMAALEVSPSSWIQLSSA